VLAMVVGIILYGGISWLMNVAPMSGSAGADIRPAIAIPIIFGFVYGPWVGFGVGLMGNLLGDTLSGYLYGVPLPPDIYPVPQCCDVIAGYFLNYQLGSGLVGFIPGVYALFRRRYRTLGDMLIALVVAEAAVIVGIGFGTGTDILFIYGQSQYDLIANTYFLPIARVNMINAAILVPILLFNYERLDLSNTRAWFSSGLVRRLSVAILISAALPVGLLGLFLIEQAATAGILQGDVNFKLGFSVLITLVFAAANAVLVAQTISRPLLRLTGAAQQMGAGELSSEQAGELKQTEGSDEIAQLSQLFGQMAQDVIVREERLKRQVEELRIEIDLAKQQQQVSEITDNEYSRELKEKVSRIRAQVGKESTAES